MSIKRQFSIQSSDKGYCLFYEHGQENCNCKKDGEEEFYGKLRSIAENLPADFIMIHQSYIINQAFVCEYSYEAVKMVNGENLNISKPYRKETRSKIKQYQKANMSDGIL